MHPISILGRRPRYDRARLHNVLKMNLQKVTHGSRLRFKFSTISLVNIINHINWILPGYVAVTILFFCQQIDQQGICL
eukprot:SAG31_NODE_3669_length_4005_cov_1.656938_2_plen_78_part_00